MGTLRFFRQKLLERNNDEAIGQAVNRRLSIVAAWFEPRSDHVGFVVNRVVLGWVFSEYFGFPCQLSFHRLFHIHHHLSSGAGTIGQSAANVPSGLSHTPTPRNFKKTYKAINQTI
jgi:hypothetical protein